MKKLFKTSILGFFLSLMFCIYSESNKYFSGEYVFTKDAGGDFFISIFLGFMASIVLNYFDD